MRRRSPSPKRPVGVEISWGQWGSATADGHPCFSWRRPLLGFLLYPPEVKKSPEISNWAAGRLKAMGPLLAQRMADAGLRDPGDVAVDLRQQSEHRRARFFGSSFINATMVVLL